MTLFETSTFGIWAPWVTRWATSETHGKKQKKTQNRLVWFPPFFSGWNLEKSQQQKWQTRLYIYARLYIYGIRTEFLVPHGPSNLCSTMRARLWRRAWWLRWASKLVKWRTSPLWMYIIYNYGIYIYIWHMYIYRWHVYTYISHIYISIWHIDSTLDTTWVPDPIQNIPSKTKGAPHFESLLRKNDFQRCQFQSSTSVVIGYQPKE